MWISLRKYKGRMLPDKTAYSRRRCEEPKALFENVGVLRIVKRGRKGSRMIIMRVGILVVVSKRVLLAASRHLIVTNQA